MMLSKRVCLKSGSVYIGLLLETFQKLKQQTLIMAHVWSLHVYLGPVPEEHSYCGLQWHASSFVPVSARGTPFCFHSCLSLSQMIFLLLSAYSSFFFSLFIYIQWIKSGVFHSTDLGAQWYSSRHTPSCPHPQHTLFLPCFPSVFTKVCFHLT